MGDAVAISVLSKKIARLQGDLDAIRQQQQIPPRAAPGIDIIHGKIDSPGITRGGSGTLSRWWQNDSGVEVDSGQDFTVYDWQVYGYATGTHAIAHRDVTSTLKSGLWYLDPPIAAFWAGQATVDSTISTDAISPATAETIGLDGRIDSRHDIWSLSSDDALTINKTATFEFTWSGNWDVEGTPTDGFHVFLEVFITGAAGGWAQVARANRGFEHGTGNVDAHSYHGSVLFDVTSGQSFRVRGYGTGSRVITVSGQDNGEYGENGLDVHEVL